MEPFISPEMDDFFLHDVMYGSSDSEEEIICTSCARGRLRQSVMMPRLPSYKVIHKKKVDFQRHLGVAESEIKKRSLGRGRAKCRQIIPQNVPPVGRSVDSASESSADERIYHVGLSHRSPSWKNELRKPKSKPLILTSDFPHLSAKSESEQQTLEETRKTVDTKNGTNFKDMAKFLMDSWKDEFTEEAQFEDVSFKDDSLEMDSNSYKENNKKKEDYLENKQNIEMISDLRQKTDEYFNKLEAETDNLSLEDFENISVSEASNRGFSQSAKEPVPPLVVEAKAQGGIWYSSDEIYVSNSKNDETWTDSDDTDVSVSTESLLPCDKSETTLSTSNKVKGCDILPHAKFDLTLPGDGIVEAQGNVSNNAISGNTHSSSSPDIDHFSSSPDIDHSSSSPNIDHSTLSLSKTESENQRTSATSDKDESEISESFEKISRKGKKKKRDVVRAKCFHSNYPDINKHNTDTDQTDKQVSNKCKKTNLSQMDSNACQQNGHGPSNHAGVSWKLNGDSVIQLDGLPVDCDISVLQDLIASYGTVKDFEKKEGSECSAVRFRLNSTDACEMVVCCLDDTDIFPDMRQTIVSKIHVKFDEKEIRLGPFDAKFFTCCFFTELFMTKDDHTDYYLVDLSGLNFESFQHLRHRINYGVALPTTRNQLISLVDVAAYLGIIETDLEQLFPELDICKDNGQEFVPLFHRLLCKGYQSMAQAFGKRALIPTLLFQDPAISYNVFKKKCRNQKNLLKWKCKYVYPTCQCPTCEVEKLKHIEYFQGD